MGKKAKSTDKIAANNGDAWQADLKNIRVSEKTDYINFDPTVFFVKTKESTSELYQAITQNCTRNTFTCISYQGLVDKAAQFGDAKKRPKDLPTNAALGFELSELFLKHVNEQQAIITQNEALDESEQPAPVPQIPSQTIAYMLKFLMVLARDEKVEKSQPRIESAAKGGKKSPKAKGKGKEEPKEPEAAKDWSTLKKRGEEEEAGNFLNDEPKTGPSHYIVVIDMPTAQLSDIVYHTAVGLGVNVHGVLLSAGMSYDSKHHGQWPTKFTKIPCEQPVAALDFDTVAEACFSVVISENVKFETFKEYLKVVDPPVLEKLPACSDVSSEVSCAMDDCLAKVLSVCQQKAEAVCNAAATPDNKNTSSLDALLQFGSDISTSSQAGSEKRAIGLPELVGKSHEGDINKIFDTETVSSQNVFQRSLYHELLTLYNGSDKTVSESLIDLALKQLAAQGQDVDNVFTKQCGPVIPPEVDVFDCIEHLSKDALFARLAELDAQYSNITMRKFNGDASRLITAHNEQSSAWETTLSGNLTHQQFFKFVLPKLDNWFALYEEITMLNNERDMATMGSMSRTAHSAQSIASQVEDSLNQQFVQKDSLKGQELNKDKDEAQTSSRGSSAKSGKKERKSSKTRVKDSRRDSRAASKQQSREAVPETAVKIEYEAAPATMPEFLGTSVGFERRLGKRMVNSNGRFQLNQCSVDLNEHHGAFNGHVVRDNGPAATQGRVILSTHDFCRDGAQVSSFVAQLPDKTCLAYERDSVKHYVSTCKGIAIPDNFSKIPEPAPSTTPGTTTANQTVTDVETEPTPEPELPLPVHNIKFGMENGMVGEFVAVDGGLAVRFSWSQVCENATDEVCGSMHPSSEFSSRLIMADGTVIDTLANGNENIIQNGQGERFHACDGELSNLVESDALFYEANDASTSEKLLQRDDGVKLVERPDGSHICHHKDGTRITSFDQVSRVEHPAYGSVLFVNNSIALTLITGTKIMANECGDTYQVIDHHNRDNVKFENGGWSLNEDEQMQFASASGSKNNAYICVKEDGSAFEFCKSEDVDRYAQLERCGVKETSFSNGMTAVTTVERINRPDTTNKNWRSGYKYQEETIIPAGLRISQIGGGSHAIVQDDPVVAIQKRQNEATQYSVRRFTKFEALDLERFRKCFSVLEDNNLPKAIIERDRAATLEQTELISSVLGGENQGLESPELTPKQISITPDEAEKLYTDAQRPVSSTTSVVSNKPSEASIKRLQQYQKEIESFKIDLIALKQKDVPKYFDSELGTTWLKTQTALDLLAKGVPSN